MWLLFHAQILVGNGTVLRDGVCSWHYGCCYLWCIWYCVMPMVPAVKTFVKNRQHHLHPANERRRYKVTPSLIGLVQAIQIKMNSLWSALIRVMYKHIVCMISLWHDWLETWAKGLCLYFNSFALERCRNYFRIVISEHMLWIKLMSTC